MLPKIIRVGQPYFDEGDIAKIQAGIASVIKSGWLTSARRVESLERKMSSIIGTRYAAALSSGTAALHAILAAIGPEKGAEVVVPANTFASSANAPLYVGARVRLADCDIASFNVNRETLEQSITSRTVAAMVTHVGGNPCEMDEVSKLCKEKGILLIEDAAHALGSRYRNRSCGSFGIANAFSFYPTKVATSAEGGVVTTNSKRIDTFVRTFRNVGRESYGHGPVVMLGYNYRMSDVHAVIGLNQLGHVHEFVKKRNELARIYEEHLSSIDWVKPQQVSRHSLSSYYAYTVRIVGRKSSRDRVMRALRKKGIETTVMFRPIHQQPYARGEIEIGRKLPNADLVGTKSLVLPMHLGMTDRDVEYVAMALKEAGPS